MTRRQWPAALALLALQIHAGMPLAAKAAGNVQAGNERVGNVQAGKASFRKCASCHQVGPSARGGFGPQLNGVLGRRAASTTDYKYSDAMRQSGIVWNEQTLAAFLRGPGDVVPGTRMRFWGISDAQQIADLLAYLRTQR